MMTHDELTALRETDRDLDLAMCSARENVEDLGIEEDTEEFDAAVADQVNGWLYNGREW